MRPPGVARPSSEPDGGSIRRRADAGRQAAVSGADCCGWRGRRRRSCANGPRRPALRPTRSAPATSVPGRAAACAAALATGLSRRVVNVLADRARVRMPSASGRTAAGPRPPRRSRPRTGGTGRRRTSRGCGRTAGRAGRRATPSGRRPRRRRSSAPRHAPGQAAGVARAAAGRAAGSCRGRAGADDDLGAALAQPAHRRPRGARTDSAAWCDAVTSLAPIMITARSGRADAAERRRPARAGRGDSAPDDGDVRAGAPGGGRRRRCRSPAARAGVSRSRCTP